MSNKIEIVSVNVSIEKGTIKQPVSEAVVSEIGIDGDAHSGDWHRQISLLSEESVKGFVAQHGLEVGPGAFAENLTVRGLDFSQISLLDRFTVGEVELEVTQIGKDCHGHTCAIYDQVGDCLMPKEGVFCRVLHGGRIAPGDAVEYSPKFLKFKIITLSDRAYRGVYEDLSGPRIKSFLDLYFRDKRWRIQVDSELLPDDEDALWEALSDARDGERDVIITTGGTGVGPRDITPEVVTDFCDKIIPGIMEAIRVKFGVEKPNALLSRAVAGVAGATLVYAIPGSVKAAEEYMGEILKTLEHLVLMLNAVDAHG